MNTLTKRLALAMLLLGAVCLLSTSVQADETYLLRAELNRLIRSDASDARSVERIVEIRVKLGEATASAPATVADKTAEERKAATRAAVNDSSDARQHDEVSEPGKELPDRKVTDSWAKSKLNRLKRDDSSSDARELEKLAKLRRQAYE